LNFFKDSQDTAVEYTVDDIQALYKLSKPATPKNGPENPKMKSKPAIVFHPRVLNIQELKRETQVVQEAEKNQGLSNVDANSSGNAYNDAASKNTNQKNNVASNNSHQENNAASKNTNQKNNVASNNSHQENNAASHAEKKSLAADGTDNVLKDYTQYHAVSQGGPRLNDVIAFKMIEISERYTPELSEYKEGRVIHIQDDTVVFRVLNQTAKKRSGRFELELEDQADEPEGEPTLELKWADVIEPRLIFP